MSEVMFADESRPVNMAPRVQINYSSRGGVIKRGFRRARKDSLENDKCQTQLCDITVIVCEVSFRGIVFFKEDINAGSIYNGAVESIKPDCFLCCICKLSSQKRERSVSRKCI